MNPRHAPPIPGNTEWNASNNAVRKIFSVPAEAIQKERERMNKLRAKKKRAKDKQ